MTKVIFDKNCLYWDDDTRYRNVFIKAIKKKVKDTIEWRGFATLLDVADLIGKMYSYDLAMKYFGVVFDDPKTVDEEIDKYLVVA